MREIVVREADHEAMTEELRIPASEVIVITTTFFPKWYPGSVNPSDKASIHEKVRGDEALKMIRRAKKIGYQFLVVDGTKENSPFREALNKTGAIVHNEVDHGMSPSRQQAIRIASSLPGVKYIAWTEEKVSFVENLALTLSPLVTGTHQIVLPKREEQLFEDTYPPYQVIAERRANHRWNRLLRATRLLKPEDEDQDAWFGPRVFLNTPELVGIFMQGYVFQQREWPEGEARTIQRMEKAVDLSKWPNATFLPIINAMAHGFSVASVTIPYKHSRKQTQIEDGDSQMDAKRDLQDIGINTGAIYFAREMTRLLREKKNRVNRLR